jgi:hypothetical protein
MEATVQVEAINWPHIAAEAIVILGPLLGGGYLAYKKLWWILSEHRPHTHGEKGSRVPLTTAGIRYPHSMNGRNKEE